MSDLSISGSSAAAPTSLDDRRRRPRRPHCDGHQITLVDGALAGEHFGCALREVGPDAACLLVRAELYVGQRVKVYTCVDGRAIGAGHDATVMRARTLTTGRYEVMVEYRRPPAAPKLSESQRRHERRQERLARVTQQPITKSTADTLLK